MPKVLLNDAQPGQKLVRPVVTRTGMVMVQPGTELTDAIIERLKTIGIDSVYIEGAHPAADKPLAKALEELDALFLGHERDSWMMELKAIVARQLSDYSSPANNA